MMRNFSTYVFEKHLKVNVPERTRGDIAD